MPTLQHSRDELLQRECLMVVTPIIMVVLFVFSWRKRFDRGRQGRLNGWDVFWPALATLILVTMSLPRRFDAADLYPFIPFAVTGWVAALAMLAQVMGQVVALWRGELSPETGKPYSGARIEIDGAWTGGVSPAQVRLDPGDVVETPPVPAAAPAPDESERADDAPTDTAKRNTTWSLRCGRRRPSVGDAQPSFVYDQRRRNTSFFAKLLLALGLFGVFVHATAPDQTDVLALNDYFLVRIARDWQPGWYVAALVLGLFGMLRARWHDGGATRWRTLAGAGLLSGAAALLLGPATYAATELISRMSGQGPTQGAAMTRWGLQRGWLEDPEHYGPLFLTAATLVGALVCLAWPRRHPRHLSL